jgi:anti-sigma factor RsiW
MSVSADEELSCQQLVELITAYLERALSPADEERFEAHLAICRDCRTYLDQMRRTIAALGTLPPETLPPPMRSQLLDAFRDWKSGKQ